MSKSSGPKARKKLAPKIKTDEQFRMTIEHDGYIYEFEGFVADFNFKIEQDYDQVDFGEGWLRSVPTMRHGFVDMGIKVVGEPIVQRRRA